MMSTPKAIASHGKYWHRSHWYHKVVACLDICESLIRKKKITGFLRNALCRLESCEHISSQ